MNTKEKLDEFNFIDAFLHSEEFENTFNNWVFDLGLKTKYGNIPDWFNLAYVLQFNYKKSLDQYADWKIKEYKEIVRKEFYDFNNKFTNN